MDAMRAWYLYNNKRLLFSYSTGWVSKTTKGIIQLRYIQTK